MAFDQSGTRTDLLEAITGDLADVGEEPEIVEQDDGTLLVDGMAVGATGRGIDADARRLGINPA